MTMDLADLYHELSEALPSQYEAKPVYVTRLGVGDRLAMQDVHIYEEEVLIVVDLVADEHNPPPLTEADLAQRLKLLEDRVTELILNHATLSGGLRQEFVEADTRNQDELRNAEAHLRRLDSKVSKLTEALVAIQDSH